MGGGEGMSTMTEDRDNTPAALPPQGVLVAGMHRCKRCNLTYLITKSTSALRLTYCSFLCELGDLGFSMAGLEAMQRKPKELAKPVGEPLSVE
jgi:hypothetical protein